MNINVIDDLNLTTGPLISFSIIKICGIAVFDRNKNDGNIFRRNEKK